MLNQKKLSKKLNRNINSQKNSVILPRILTIKGYTVNTLLNKDNAYVSDNINTKIITKNRNASFPKFGHDSQNVETQLPRAFLYRCVTALKNITLDFLKYSQGGYPKSFPVL